ncbi:unnamed protein product [Musa textilis]
MKAVVLLDFWASPFGQRCRIALAEKGVEYEYREENIMGDKSPLLLEYNPVYKRIPVLILDGKPLCESLIIVQYIDEAWPDRAPLLPADPYARAQARFWADFVDKKVRPPYADASHEFDSSPLRITTVFDRIDFPSPRNPFFFLYRETDSFAHCLICSSCKNNCEETVCSQHSLTLVFMYQFHDCGNRLWKLKGDAQAAVKEEFIEILKLLEGELGDKKYFGGDAFGFVDIALVPFVCWFYTYETCAGFSIEEAAPKVVSWGKRCMERESVANALSDPHKIYEAVNVYKKRIGIE